MFCNNCGKEITEDAKFCTYCGQANSKLIIQENREITGARVIENVANVGGNITTRIRDRKTIDYSSGFRNRTRSF